MVLLVLEVSLLGFVLFIAFSHFQAIINRTPPWSLLGLWGSFMIDITQYPLVWVAFGSIFAGWLVLKIKDIKHTNEQDEAFRRDITGIKKTLESIDKKLGEQSGKHK